MTAPTPLSAPPFVLRPYACGDEALYVELFCSEAVMREVGPPFALERAERAAAASLRHQDDEAGRFRHWIIEHAEGRAGLLGLALRSERWVGGEVELGVLLRPAWQARGAATAAITAVMPWAFRTAQIATLTCHHAPTNSGAAALMRRLGFAQCPARADAPWPCGWEHRAEDPLAR